MAISNESYRTISNHFGYTESALKRHTSNHLAIDLAIVREAMQQAREDALRETHERELAEIKVGAAQTISGRLEQARSFFEQLKILRERAAMTLEKAEESEDPKTVLLSIRELRELIRIWAELEGRLANQPAVNILINPQWVELRSMIIEALEPYPDAKEAVINAIHT